MRNTSTAATAFKVDDRGSPVPASASASDTLAATTTKTTDADETHRPAPRKRMRRSSFSAFATLAPLLEGDGIERMGERLREEMAMVLTVMLYRAYGTRKGSAMVRAVVLGMEESFMGAVGDGDGEKVLGEVLRGVEGVEEGVGEGVGRVGRVRRVRRVRKGMGMRREQVMRGRVMRRKSTNSML